jgi:hypothetical protein
MNRDMTIQARFTKLPAAASTSSSPPTAPTKTPAAPAPIPIPYPVMPSRLSPELNSISTMITEGKPAPVILDAWKGYVARRVQAKQSIDVNTTIAAIDRDANARLQAEIERRQAQLNTIGDDSQLANVDLQNALQKQQQTLQMLSNLMKMMHDSAMAIIRNLKG